MMYDLSRAERHHQTILTETPPVSLVAKRCACGKAAFARQLAQHGKCVACQLADRVATLEPGDIDILRFMLGATPHHAQSKWGFRNEYHCYRRDIESTQRLIRAGFIECAGSLGICIKFRANAAGCRVAGLTGKRIDRALGVRP